MEQYKRDGNDVSKDTNEEEYKEEDKEKIKRHVCSEKFHPVIDHVSNVSHSLIFASLAILSLDKTIIHFFVKSLDTNLMKTKPIKECYTLFVLTTKARFVVEFTPYSRTVATRGEQECTNNQAKGKI